MFDREKRKIDYIRISITDRCNLRCRYCMPKEGVPNTPHEAILTYEELLYLADVFQAVGITKVKVTGGEPLVRKGAVPFIAALCGKMEEVTLTTNGLLLEEAAAPLKAAGLAGLNLSLDTLSPETYRAITGRDGLQAALAGLGAALAAGLPVKVNVVPQRGVNENELTELAALAKEKNIQVRFIEMMPLGLGKQVPGLSGDKVKELLEAAFGPMEPVAERLGNGPAHYFHAQGFSGNIGFISAVSHRFCQNCNRVRLTATGLLKPCLQYAGGTDLRALLRAGAGDAAIREAVEEAIWAKPAGHAFGESCPAELLEEKNMNVLGG